MIILNCPVAGELPIDASIMPIPQAISPFSRLAPESTLTMVMPRMVSSRSSPVPKASTSGRAIRMAPVSTIAPNTPPTSEEA